MSILPTKTYWDLKLKSKKGRKKTNIDTKNTKTTNQHRLLNPLTPNRRRRVNKHRRLNRLHKLNSLHRLNKHRKITQKKRKWRNRKQRCLFSPLQSKRWNSRALRRLMRKWTKSQSWYKMPRYWTSLTHCEWVRRTWRSERLLLIDRWRMIVDHRWYYRKRRNQVKITRVLHHLLCTLPWHHQAKIMKHLAVQIHKLHNAWTWDELKPSIWRTKDAQRQ